MRGLGYVAQARAVGENHARRCASRCAGEPFLLQSLGGGMPGIRWHGKTRGSRWRYGDAQQQYQDTYKGAPAVACGGELVRHSTRLPRVAGSLSQCARCKEAADEGEYKAQAVSGVQNVAACARNRRLG